MIQKKMSIKYISFLLTFVLITSTFSVGVFGQEKDKVTFNSEIAGLTPDSFWYFLDFGHTPEELIHEAGLMVESGNYNDARNALEDFALEIEAQQKEVEGINIEGISLENIKTNEELVKFYEIQTDLLNSKVYIDSINSIIAEETDQEISNLAETINSAEEAINSIGSDIELRAMEIIDEAAETSNVASIEVDFAFEEGLQEYAEERFPATNPRFQEISNVNDVQVLKEKISELRAELLSLEESGNTENLEEVRELLRMAESHGVYCLHADESELGITADIHLNAAEDFLANAEDLLSGEIEAADIQDELEHSESLSSEEIQAEVENEKRDAEIFKENYENLKGEFASDPIKLAVIEAENERLQKVEKLGALLYDNGVMEKWTNELSDEGLSGNELDDAIHERWMQEWENIYGEKYVPPGMYETPGTVQAEETEIIDIGRIYVTEAIDPETGEIKREIKGYYDGKIIDDLKEGGGYALGESYLDPDNGIYYTFTSSGYTYTTPAGIEEKIDYPPEFKPENEYEYGDEVYSYTTEEGNIVSYSATGYEVKDSETEEILVEEPYVEEKTQFIDGSYTDLEATGYIFNDADGEAYVYAYIPEFKTYQDISSGKVIIPPSAPHFEATNYDAITNTYKYSYGSETWTYSGNGLWKNPAGVNVQMPVVPAPVGYEDSGSYTTPNGEQWTYKEGIWVESASGKSYTPAPNNQYRYNENTGYMVDSQGNKLAPVGTSVTINGETFTVTNDKGWTNSKGEAVAPPYDSATGKQYPDSATYQISEGDRRGSVWSYDTASNHWVSSETGDKYDPSTGNIIHPDGSVYTPENRESEECYGCYQDSEGAGTSHYRYSGGYYESAPTGGYNYYNSDGEYQGASTVTDSQGNTWTRSSDGTWSSSSGSYTPGAYSGYDSSTGTYVSGGHAGGPGSSYPGASSSGGGAYGGGYDSSGNYVGGSYGGYDSSGSYVGTGGGSTGESGGSTGGSTGESSGGSTGDSGSSGSTGSSGGDGGGGGSTGAVISEDIEGDNIIKGLIKIIKNLF